MLSGEQMLDTSTLIQLVRNSGAQLVVFNTCESEPVGLFVHYSGRICYQHDCGCGRPDSLCHRRTAGTQPCGGA